MAGKHKLDLVIECLNTYPKIEITPTELEGIIIVNANVIAHSAIRDYVIALLARKIIVTKSSKEYLIIREKKRD